MTREETTRKAQAVADASRVTLVVAHAPYAEYETDRWTYYPEGAAGIFRPLETVVETIHPGAVRLDDFGCYVWLEDETLFCGEINDFDEHGKSADSVGEVTAPEGQGFLDAANKVLGTDFKFDQFAGR